MNTGINKYSRLQYQWNITSLYVMVASQRDFRTKSGNATEFRVPKMEQHLISKPNAKIVILFVLHLSFRACPDSLCQGGCSAVTWLPKGSPPIGHRCGEHVTAATAEAAGALSATQERLLQL